MERQRNSRPIAEIFKDILDNDPKPIAAYVPSNGDEQKELFLSGIIDNPRHAYPKLETLDFTARDQKLKQLLEELQRHDEVSDKHQPAYADFVATFRAANRRMQIAHQLHTEGLTDSDRFDLEREYLQSNIETYGEPDRGTYHALVAELKTSLANKDFSGTAAKVYGELLGLLPDTADAPERYKPSEEVVEWVREVAESLYGNMMQHVPEREEPFGPQEVRDIFEAIVRDEFGESADGWQVIVTKAASINVVASEKLIKIPEDRKPIPTQELKGLVAHEIGVHMLRAVMGEQSDLLPMQVGLAEYYDAEEGLGKVMEQAVKGKYVDAGIPYYLTVGLMYYDQQDFRGAFEVMWRRKLLLDAKGSDVDEEAVTAARTDAYKTVMRIARGADTLPWFKDLAYYNGTESQWKHMEDIMGDDLRFLFVLLGKGDSTNKEHVRIMYETRTQ